MVAMLLILPVIIQKMGGMYKLNVIGYIVATVGRLGVMVAGYMGNIPLMLAFTAIATLGIAPLQGDLNALIASCSEHTTMKTGHRLDYIKNAAVQTTATIGMLQFLYLWAPAILCLIVTFLLSRLKVEKANKLLMEEKNI